MDSHETHTGTLPQGDQRYFESYLEGATYELGTFFASQAEMVAFASSYDPQPMHTDTEREGGVIASGWHTACLAMRLIAENFLPGKAGLPSPGVDSIAWTYPVRPNDVIRLEALIESARASRSKPDRGILTTSFVARNAADTEVMRFRAVNMLLRRD